MIEAVFLIGLPAVGKSRFASEHFSKWHYITIDPVRFIQNETVRLRKPFNKASIDELHSHAIRMSYKMAENAIGLNWNIIWDDLNLTRENRFRKLRMLPGDAHKVAYVFDVPPLDEWLNQIKHLYDKDDLQKMMDKIELPTEDEFDKIVKC